MPEIPNHRRRIVLIGLLAIVTALLVPLYWDILSTSQGRANTRVLVVTMAKAAIGIWLIASAIKLLPEPLRPARPFEFTFCLFGGLAILVGLVVAR